MESNLRQEFRLVCDDTIFIETFHSYSADGQAASKIIICNSVDISANGMQALIDEALPIHAIYPLCIEMADSGQTIYLVAEVKWQRENPEGGYFVGLMLFESDDTDIEQWKTYIAEKLS